MKRLLVFVFAVTLLGSCTESVTLIPDENFEKALIELGYDDKLDGGVITSNINGIVALWIDEKDIYDLTGIEDFTALTELNCSSNQFTSLDVSKNTALTYLGLFDNKLTSLDISNNTALTYLNCRFGQLTNLDLSKNRALEELYCDNNQLTNLDVSKNTALRKLQCVDNRLTNLDLSNNPDLTLVLCDGNKFDCHDLMVKYGLAVPYHELLGF